MQNNRNGIRKTLLGFAIAALVPVVCASIVWGGADARALLKESENRHRTKTMQSTVDVIVTSKEGKVRKKCWKSFMHGFAGDAKVLSRVTAPPEVKGVGMLTLPRPGGQNPDQWLYLPSMKRERRIANQDRDGSYVGTDFNYEDFEEFDHEKFKVSLQGEQAFGGYPCYVITAIPLEKGGKSVYEKKILFLRKDILVFLRVDLFRKGDKEPGKRLILSDYKIVDGHWTAQKWEMSDFKKGSKTVILLKEIAFDKPQPPNRFTLQNLNREGGD